MVHAFVRRTRNVMLAAALALIAGLVQAQALDLTLDNVVIPNPRGTIFVPRIVFHGTNLTEPELKALLGSDTPAAERMALAARLKAERIVAPKIVLLEKQSLTILTDVDVSKVVDGAVERAVIAGFTMLGKAQDDRSFAVNSGEFTVNGADVAAMLGVEGRKPSSQRYTWRDLEISVADPSVAAGFADAAVTVMNAVAGTLTLDFQRFQVNLPPGSEQSEQFRRLGLDALEGRFSIAMTYDADAKSFKLDKVAVDYAGLGALTVNASFSGIDKALADPDNKAKALALLGAGVTSFDVQLRDAGLLEKMFAAIAADQNLRAADVQAQAGPFVRQFLPAVLGSGPDVRPLADALASFVSGKSSLSVSLRPKSGSFGVVDAMSVNSPSEFMKLVSVTARAETPAAEPPAAPALTAPVPAQPPPPPQPPLKRVEGREALALILGNTLAGPDEDGDLLIAHFRADGTVVQADDDDKAAGTWRFEGTRLCVDFSDGDKPCYALAAEGSVVTLTDEAGSASRLQIIPGNPIQL